MPPDYGVARSAEGLLNWEEVRQRLVAARNYWVATTRPDGGPHVMPVWGLWLDEAVWFSSDPDSRKGRNLIANSRAVVHLESGDDAVILEGSAERVKDTDLLARFADEYDEKYGFRVDVHNPAYAVYRVRPRAVFAWHERNFPNNATRWHFASDSGTT